MALAPPEWTDKSSRRSPPELFLAGLSAGALRPAQDALASLLCTGSSESNPYR